MKKLVLSLIILGLGATPVFAATVEFNNVPVVDVNCSRKMAAHPDAHTRSCDLMCARSGFGIYTKDHKYLKFDAAGNKEVLQELKASNQKDHLRVDVKGQVEGNVLKVSSVKLM